MGSVRRRPSSSPPGPASPSSSGGTGRGSRRSEALELLLTGDTFRWAGRTKVWREGWRNLHQPDAAVSATFHLEGAGATRVQRTWEDGASLEDTATEVVRPNEGPRPLDVLGWTDAVHAYRPFLSYAELGSMLDEGPSKLYDALAGVLGLDALVETQERLRQARLTREKALKAARADLAPILEALEETDDERASRCLEALRDEPWDLDAVEGTLTGQDESTEDDLALLRALATLKTPDPDEVERAASRLDEAARELDRLQDTDAGRARHTARLLQEALDHHAAHGDEDCPVCGGRVLDTDWRHKTEAEIERLSALATDADHAAKAFGEAERSARELVVPVPDVLDRAGRVGVATEEAVGRWKAWAEAPSGSALATHLREAIGPLAEAVEAVRTASTEELERREDVWRPVARELGAWLAGARPAVVGPSG